MSKKNKKNRTLPKTGHVITSGLFLVLVFGFASAGIASPDRKFSEMENRTLQQAPEFSVERLKKGEFTADIEQYMSDQIFLKDELVALKTGADRTLGKTCMNGVYLGEDGFYIQDYKENTALVDQNIACLNSFAESLDEDIPVSFLLAPNASCVLRDKLPARHNCGDQEKTIGHIRETLSDRIDLACPAEALKAEGIRCYYRTDHHWTADGAELGYSALRQTMGLPAAEGLERNVEELENFYGTLYSKAPAAWADSDTIKLVSYEGSDITVKYVSQAGDHLPPAECTEIDGIPTKSGLFAEAPKSTKDKYAAIMGGNFALAEIDSNGITDENVLVLKDSYANAVLPELCAQFTHISLIDLRYYHMEAESVSEYVKSHDIDRVIMLYNVDFINSDNNFVWLE
ncbi:DHHW family protein [Ruminococcus sp.]|uniref:DHHW family protein n=1 Tax=Ruminococcus sp. TaxID=41978 RepID=UPI0025EA0F27|nr:DHHW family protein [Ruminococcus sp.]MBQ8966452.1 hypothetical protein [Ruminococcus sp.]